MEFILGAVQTNIDQDKKCDFNNYAAWEMMNKSYENSHFYNLMRIEAF